MACFFCWFRFEGSCLKIIAPYGASVGDEMVHCYGEGTDYIPHGFINRASPSLPFRPSDR